MVVMGDIWLEKTNIGEGSLEQGAGENIWNEEA
jgi:hypothetical protein